MTSINPIYRTNYLQAQTFKANKTEASMPITNSVTDPNLTFRGTEALRAYNYNLINKNNDFDIPTIEAIQIPEDITKIEGNPIYNSKGELGLVEKIVGDKKYIYHAGKEHCIEVYNEDGEKIKEQHCFTNLNNEKMLIVREFKNGDKEVFSSGYISENGKDFELFDKSKKINYPDGSDKEFIHYVKEKYYDVIERSNMKNTNWLFDRSINYDEDKNIKSIVEHSSDKDSYKEIQYKNGIPYAIETKETKSIKNDMGKYFMDDPDLIPSLPTEIPENPEKLEGKKTYFSNGVVESNTVNENGKIKTYHFDYTGKLNRIVEKNKTTYTLDKLQKITETNGKEEKTTFLSENGYVSIEYKNGNIEKRISFMDGKIRDYDYIENGKGKMYTFSQDGSLREISDFDREYY